MGPKVALDALEKSKSYIPAKNHTQICLSPGPQCGYCIYWALQSFYNAIYLQACKGRSLTPELWEGVANNVTLLYR